MIKEINQLSLGQLIWSPQPRTVMNKANCTSAGYDGNNWLAARFTTKGPQYITKCRILISIAAIGAKDET